jgi:hypothetical protein
MAPGPIWTWCRREKSWPLKGKKQKRNRETIEKEEEGQEKESKELRITRMEK